MKILWLALLIPALIVVGCVQAPQSSTAIKDCGTDLACFKVAVLNSCQAAKVTISHSGVTVYGEVSVSSGSTCNIFIQLKDIVLPDNASAADKQQVDQLRPLFPLATMNCKVNSAEGSLLDDPSFLAQPSLLANCTGMLKDQIAQRAGLYK